MEARGWVSQECRKAFEEQGSKARAEYGFGMYGRIVEGLPRGHEGGEGYFQAFALPKEVADHPASEEVIKADWEESLKKLLEQVKTILFQVSGEGFGL